jgi:hypothetical protein
LGVVGGGERRSGHGRKIAPPTRTKARNQQKRGGCRCGNRPFARVRGGQ